MTQIDRAAITDTYDTIAARAARHLPGGKLLPIDKQGLIKRTASLCGTTEKAVSEALSARTTTARAAAL